MFHQFSGIVKCIYWTFIMDGFLFSHLLFIFTYFWNGALEIFIASAVCVHNVCVDVCMTVCLWGQKTTLWHWFSSSTSTWLSWRIQIPGLLQVAHLPAKHTLERCFALYWTCNFDNVDYFCYCIIIAILPSEENLLDL